MIRLELRCRNRKACLLALVRQEAGGRLVADVKVRYAVMKTADSQEWQTDRRTVEIGADELLLGCQHVQGIVTHADTIRAYVRETPIGVRLIG